MCHFVCIALNEVHKSGCVGLECFVERNIDLFLQLRYLGYLSSVDLTCLS